METIPTSAGAGIQADPIPTREAEHSVTPASVAELREEFQRAVADVEFRLAQQYELKRRMETGEMDRVYAEDIVSTKHMLTGYTLTSNSPSAGSIAWSSLHIVYLGVDYTAVNGNTTNKFVWFVKPGSGTSVTLNTGNTVPTLGPDDQLLFINDGGVARVADNSVAYAVAPGSVGNTQLVDGAVTAAKTDFYTALNTAITNAQTAADLAQATADGAINTYFQAAQPWANGSSHTPDRIGDIWYDSDDGQAWRWSGNGGTWVMIEDSNIASALAAANAAQTTANTKIQTFYAANASTPTATAVGDMWVVTDQNNKLRRASATGTGSWVDVLLGDQAISGIGGSKVGTGISATNITTGTLTGSLVGTGINATNITTGTVPVDQVPTLTATKLNTAFHMLY